MLSLQHDAVLFTFLALAASIVVCWLPRVSSAWPYLFSASLMSAAYAGIASVTGVLLLGAAIASLYGVSVVVEAESLSSQIGGSRCFFFVFAGAFAVQAVGIATGFFPGFEKVAWYRDVQLTPDAAPFALSLNYGKAAVGALILGMMQPALRRRAARHDVWSPLLVTAITVALVSVLSVMLGYTRIAPQWHALFWPWAAVNLLFVCVAEEAFFRGFLQEFLTRRLTPVRHGHLVAWLAASALFGIAHAGGGAGMVLLASVAGLGYGWVYLRTRSLGAAVLAHFSLNAVHFLLLTYPRLY